MTCCYSLGDCSPSLPAPDNFWIAPNASLIGDVELHEQASIWFGAKIGRNCLIAAGALIKEGTVIADNSLVVGMPGRVIRTLDAAAVSNLRKSAESYVQRAIRYRAELL